MPRQLTLEELLKLSQGSSSVRNKSQAKKPKRKTSTQRSPSPVPVASRRRQPAKRRRSATPDSGTVSDTDSDVRAIEFEAPKEEVIDISDDDLEPVATLPTQRRSKRQRAPPTPPSSGSESQLSEESDDDDDIPLVATARKSKRRTLIDSEDEENAPKRRKLVRGKGRATSSEDDDLLEEVDREHIIEARLRGPSKKTAFSSKLEALKLRRKGNRLRPDAPEEASDSGEDVRDSNPDAPFRGARPDGEELSDVENEEEDDGFVVEDSGNEAVELPAQFSRQSHQDMSMHFKVVCQLYVMLAIQGADGEDFMKKAQSNEYFTLSLSALDRKLGALRDSLVRSSVWKPKFTDALNTYPEFGLTDLEFSLPNCDACNMGARTSTLVGRCSGEPYRRDTFEPKEGRESDNESDDQQEDTGPALEFHLGRFCAARGKVYHAFTHWQYLLYWSLKSEVDLLQSPGKRKKSQAFMRISWGRDVEPPKDFRNGNDVMQWLDDRGIIQAEWRQIKKLMERAHHLDAQRYVEDDDLGF